MDRARTGTFINNRFTTELDVNDGTVYSFLRDTFKITPPQPAQIISQSDRRYGGGRVVGETHGNGLIDAEWYVGWAGSAQATLNNTETLLASLNKADPGRYFEWRPEAAPNSSYYELRGPTPGWEPQYRWIEFQQQKAIHLHGTFQTAPLAIGDPMDVNDTFAVDTRADYTFDAATSADVNITGGQLVPVVGASLATERRLVHTARGYALGDSQVWAPFFVGPTVTGYKIGGVLRRTAANNYLEAYIDDNGTNSRFRVDKIVAGTRTNLFSANLAARLVANSVNWMIARIEGSVVYMDLHGPAAPLQMTTAGNLYAGSYALTPAEQAQFTTGSSGVSWVPADAAAYIEEVKIEPYTYKGPSIIGPGVTPNPQVMHLGGAIPGSAPALTDVSLSNVGSGLSFGLIAWAPTNVLSNRLLNGDFEDDVDWWSNGGSFYNGSATSYTRVTTAGKFKFGTAALEVVTPGTGANQGVFHSLHHRLFKRGVTYTASVWLRAAAGTATAEVVLGSGAGTDGAVIGSTALSPTYTKVTGTWTPTADRYDVLFVIRIPASVAQTFTIDGATVVEGTTLPTAYPQSEGRGGNSPFGPIEGESYDPSDSTSVAIAGDSPITAMGGPGWVARWTPVAGTAGKVSYYLDPSLLSPDTFAATELRMEVWARVVYPSTLTRLAIAASVKNPMLGSERFTGEFGQAGRPMIPVAASGGGPLSRLTRLGTLVVPADQTEPARWKLSVYFTAASTATGVLDLDYVLLVPAQQRAASPTSKAVTSGYPLFANYLVGTKRIRSNLSGAVQGQLGTPFTQDSGLGGQLLELNPGANDMMVFGYGGVPDDPTVSNGNDRDNPANRTAWHAAITPRYFLARGT